jgi:hypothetical protein
MKKTLATVCITALMMIFSISAFAQKKQSWIPEKGHWMLVSNVHDRKTITVQFYNDDNALIYQETLTNVKMNPNRKKVRRQLCLALDEAYDKWAANVAIGGMILLRRENKLRATSYDLRAASQ